MKKQIKMLKRLNRAVAKHMVNIDNHLENLRLDALNRKALQQREEIIALQMQ